MLLLGVLTVVGTLLSDLLLMWIDPRIRLGHDPMSDAVIAEPLVTEAETRVAVATQRQLIWWRFRQHQLAVVSAASCCAVLPGRGLRRLPRLSPTRTTPRRARSYIPPQPIHWFDDGRRFRPQVYGLKGKRDPRTFKLVYTPDPSASCRSGAVRARLSATTCSA